MEKRLKEKKLKRPELYKRILKFIKQKPAYKTPGGIAYFTTDHLRAINAFFERVESCKLPKTR
jgi:hypothetical protein